MNIENRDAGSEETIDQAVEAKNGAEVKTGKETNQDESIQGGETDPVDGGEDQETEGNGGENGAEASGEEEITKSEPGVDLAKLEENILSKIDERMKASPPPPQPITEEQWVEHETKWGIPRTAIQKNIDLAIRVKNEMKEYVDSKFATIEKDAAIQSLSKEPGFQNISSLRPGMEDFLKDYDAKNHSNPILLKKAAIYARGLSADKKIQQVRNSNEKNRQVLGRIKTGNSDVPGKNGTQKLNDSQRQAAELMGSESEYLKYKKASKQPIAI